MKLIPLREFPGLKTIDILKAVIERPSQGAGVAAIRAGCRVLDALETGVHPAGGVTPAGLVLEDADHAFLAKAVGGFTFGVVSKDLLTVIDDVLNAEAPRLPAAAA